MIVPNTLPPEVKWARKLLTRQVDKFILISGVVCAHLLRLESLLSFFSIVVLCGCEDLVHDR
jgi:hypothetical protein